MFELVFTLEGDTEKREKGADNLIVLAREKAGAKLLYKEGVVARIVRLMKVEKNVKIRLSCVRVIGELAKKDTERARTIVKEAGLPFFIDSVSRYDLIKKWKDKKKDITRMSNEDRRQSRM